MPQRGDERSLVKNRKGKSREINRAYDPKPFFELEPGRAHDSICIGGRSPLQCAIGFSVR
jgi:hypothetical protein